MCNFALAIVLLFLATGTAHAQCDFFGPGGGCVNRGDSITFDPSIYRRRCDLRATERVTRFAKQSVKELGEHSVSEA